jgi:hypothetical protein
VGLRWGDAQVGWRHRLGGDCPVHDVDRPVCSSCSESMWFYGQLDSMNDKLVVADAGLLAVFLCDGCGEAAAVVVTHDCGSRASVVLYQGSGGRRPLAAGIVRVWSSARTSFSRAAMPTPIALSSATCSASISRMRAEVG